MSIRLIGGDCREVLATLPANSVHCVCTSPPYYGLRDYGTAQWAGGDAGCDHKPLGQFRSTKSTLDQGAEYSAMPFGAYRNACGKCGATRVDRQIGLEASPDLYLAEMVAVFREVKRVLRPDGTCWVNMGDRYSGNANSGGIEGQRSNGAGNGKAGNAVRLDGMAPKPGKPKDLLLMPARLALALQADGWWLRSDIIWSKPNPMPESVTDRPTSAHEHVFLLAKAARYFYDADAVREEAINEGRVVSYDGTQKNTGHHNPTYPGAKPRDILVSGRNLRNVWTIATAPYSEAHFATFPPALAERCIRAGTSERGCCAACGAPWGRVVERGVIVPDGNRKPYAGSRIAGSDASDAGTNRYEDGHVPGYRSPTTTGWAPSCACAADTVPCTVLDPFAGAGTTLLVADRLQRDAIGIELSPDYTRMAMDRCRDDAPLFAEPSPPPAEAPEEPPIRDLFA